MYPEKNIRVRGHCRIADKYRARQFAMLINTLTQMIPVRFHNLRGYGSHNILQEIGKFNQKINVIPNGIAKYMAYHKINLAFTDNM